MLRLSRLLQSVDVPTPAYHCSPTASHSSMREWGESEGGRGREGGNKGSNLVSFKLEGKTYVAASCLIRFASLPNTK